MNIYSGRCTFSTFPTNFNIPTCKAVLTCWLILQGHVVYSPRFSWRYSYSSITATKATGFPTGLSHYELKAFDVLLDNKLFVIRWNLFWVFLIVFCWRGKITNTSSSSLRSFYTYRKLNRRRECKVLYEEGQYSRIAFCVKNN